MYMKVHDIISESRIINESKLSSLFGAVLEKVSVAEIDKALAYLARLVASKTGTPREIAEAWAAASKKTGLPMENVVAMGERELLAAGVDKAVVDSAIKEAERFAPGIAARLSKNISSAADKITYAKSIMGTSFDLVSGVLHTLAVWEPVVEVAYNIGVDYVQYQQGKMTEKTFHESAQYWLNDGVGKVAAALIGNTAIAVGFSVPGSIGIGKFRPFYKLASGLSKTAQMGLNAWLITPQGRDWLAKLIMSDTFGQITGPDGKPVPALKFIRDTVGGWMTEITARGYEVVQKYTDPAAADAKDQARLAQDATDQAKLDALPKFSAGYKTDQYGKQIR